MNDLKTQLPAPEEEEITLARLTEEEIIRLGQIEEEEITLARLPSLRQQRRQAGGTTIL